MSINICLPNLLTFFYSCAYESPFYQSQAFDRIIQFANANAHRCRMEESSTRASLLISDVGSVREAVELLKRI